MGEQPPRRRRWSGLAGAIAGGLVVVLYCTVIRPAAYRRQARPLIKRYRTAPDQKTAQALADLLDQQRLPKRLGNEILELLVTPEVAVRAAYPAGQGPHVAVDHPVSCRFSQTALHCGRSVWVEGRRARGSAGGMSTVGPGSQVLAVQVPVMPGTYDCALDYDWVLARETVGQDIPPSQEEKAVAVYSCAFRVPFVVRIVEPDRAERIERRTSPELDRGIRSAIRVTKEMYGEEKVLETGERYRTRGHCRVDIGSLPENVGLRFTYRDQGGMAMPVPGWSLRLRASMPATSAMLPIGSLMLPPGRYQGTAILRADEAAAYPDAAIKTIWGGTIELPIEFIVRVSKAGDAGGGER